jgi:hypothetical protein
MPRTVREHSERRPGEGVAFWYDEHKIASAHAFDATISKSVSSGMVGDIFEI